MAKAYDNQTLAKYTTKSTSYSITTSDDVISFSAAAIATLPSAVGISGKRYTIQNLSGGYTVTVNTTSSQTINGKDAGGGILITEKGNFITVMSDGSNWLKVNCSIDTTLQTFFTFGGPYTYTPRAGVSFVRIKAMSGGGGGGGGGTQASSGNSGSQGGTTSVGAIISITGGAGGTGAKAGRTNAAPGIPTFTPTKGFSVVGGYGGTGLFMASGTGSGVIQLNGGSGGGTYTSGGANSQITTGTVIAATNTGEGGSGGTAYNQSLSNTTSGCGGGGGSYVEVIVANPTTYSVSVGEGGGGGVGGSGMISGTAGAAGFVIFEEHY